MNRDASEILKEALTLPAKDRAELADSLLESLDEGTDPEVEDAWRQEIRRRVSEIDKGLVRTIPWSEVRARMIAALSDDGK
jgi:putative addiction module component (TIGR02574 family)